MGQDNNQQSPQAGTIPEWFSDTGIPPTPVPPKQPKKIPRIAFIIGGIVILLGICAGAVIAITALSQKSNCLDTADYRSLTGIDLVEDDLSPTTHFYTEYVLFKDGSTDYDDTTDSAQHGSQLIQRIASFYASRATKPMLIAISGSYFVSDNETLTNQRMEAVKSSLLASGVPEGVIAIADANYIEPEDALEGDGDTGEIVISITSDPTCR